MGLKHGATKIAKINNYLISVAVTYIYTYVYGDDWHVQGGCLLKLAAISVNYNL